MGHSGRKIEELVHKTHFACHAALCQAAMAAAVHPHHLEAFDGGGGSFRPLEAAGRPDYTLERSIVGLNDVIQLFRCSVLNTFQQQALFLQAPDCLGIRRQFVRRN